MACGISFETATTSTVLFLLILLQAALVWDEVHGAPAKRNDILAGTEFLSVFINGAMAPTPQRRRGFRRGGSHTAAAATDSATSESQHEASIYRISKSPNVARPMLARTSGTNGREEVVRFYPISQRTLETRRQNLASLIDDLSTAGEITSTHLTPFTATTKSTTTTTTTTSRSDPTIRDRSSQKINGTGSGASRGSSVGHQRVIGVSVTSTVKATPYKVRVEHHDTDSTVMTRPGSNVTFNRDANKDTRRGTMRFSTTTATTVTRSTTAATTTGATTKTPITTSSVPGHVVTEELSNIVSESNRSEFTVDEGAPRTSWPNENSATPRTTVRHTSTYTNRHHTDDIVGTTHRHEADVDLPREENYELPEENSEPHEFHEEPMELGEPSNLQPQGRKAGRHYDASHYNRPGSKIFGQSFKPYKPARQYSEPAKVYSEPAKVYGEPEKVYSEPAKVYGEPAKVYSEPAKVYGEPAKVYGEPAKVYGEPEKVYSEPSKIYSEPAKVYSEPAKVYSQPAKVYGEPSKVYDSEGHPINRDGGEPDEQNYEVDESVSVGSNGNVHGPQLVVTETPGQASELEDGHKVGYVVEGTNYRKYQVEERTPDGFIVGEYGVVSHDDGSLRGVRYTADGSTNPRLIYETLMKFLNL